MCSTTSFNDKVEIQLLTLQFCFSSQNIIWEKFYTFHKTKQSCPSGPSGWPVVNLAIWYFSEQEERKGNTHYYIFLLHGLWNSYSPVYFNTDLYPSLSGKLSRRVTQVSPFPLGTHINHKKKCKENKIKEIVILKDYCVNGR